MPMQVRADSLAAHLTSRSKAGALAPIYVVASDEPLLAMEAQDAIRACARNLGHSEREVFTADARFDWSQLSASAAGLSLFAQRRIVELRLPSGKPGVRGAEALRQYAQSPAEDLLFLLALPKTDSKTRSAAWVAALEGAGVWIEIDRIERPALPRWIGERLARQQQSAPAEALAFIADRVEGNLLAAHQEIAKLGLLYPAGELAIEQVSEAVLDVARFDIFALPAALMAGDATRVLRLLEGLRAEGAAVPLLVWMFGEELRLLLRARAALAAGTPMASIARELRIWGPREKALPAALKRVSDAKLAQLLDRLADVDRLSKGLRASRRDSDPWLELADLSQQLCAS
jgi:DNA polymerase III subunit delta